MTRVYTAGPDGRCIVCQRHEAEHAPEAWTADARACPPPRQCPRCGASLLDHDEGCPDATPHPAPETDRDEAAHTLVTAQDEIARLRAALARCEEARDAMALQVGDRDREIARLVALDAVGPPTGWQHLRSYSETQLIAHLRHLRGAGAGLGPIVEQTYALRIAATERELAIRNVRETVAQEEAAS